MNWIISANSNIYDHAASFKKRGYIDWRQSGNFQVGDIIYIYSTRPSSKVEYKCIVEKINIPFNKIADDKKFWIDKDEYYTSQKMLYNRLKLIKHIDSEELHLSKLKKHGLKAAPQGPTRLIDERVGVKIYIESVLKDSITDVVYPDEVHEENLYEGAVKEVKVNAYERNIRARNKCIEHFGLDCIICGFNFEEVYGELGEGFIHVHHLIPLSELGKNYKVDPKKDLVPVCPNCHTMLHRKHEGSLVSINELKLMMKNK